MPGKRTETPDTLRRSPARAQRTYQKTHDSAVEQYGEGERAHRVALASVEHSFEKVGDHWEPPSSGCGNGSVGGLIGPRARQPQSRHVPPELVLQ